MINAVAIATRVCFEQRPAKRRERRRLSEDTAWACEPAIPRGRAHKWTKMRSASVRAEFGRGQSVTSRCLGVERMAAA